MGGQDRTRHSRALPNQRSHRRRATEKRTSQSRRDGATHPHVYFCLRHGDAQRGEQNPSVSIRLAGYKCSQYWYTSESVIRRRMPHTCSSESGLSGWKCPPTTLVYLGGCVVSLARVIRSGYFHSWVHSVATCAEWYLCPAYGRILPVYLYIKPAWPVAVFEVRWYYVFSVLSMCTLFDNAIRMPSSNKSYSPYIYKCVIYSVVSF